MVGSIDPRCETVRGTHWPKKVAWLFGARVAETILASDPLRPHQQAGHMDASDPIRPEKLLRHGGRPHVGPGSRSRSLSSGARSRDPLARLSGKTASEYSSTQLRAGHQDVAGDLAGAGGEFIAQAPRCVGIAFQHALKQAAR